MKQPLSIIQPIAKRIVNDIKEHCELINIAGSIRRKSPYCKDIEIVLTPKGRSERTRIGTYFIMNGRVLKGKFTGRYVQIMIYGQKLDLFIPQSHAYWRQFAIRTGSADYSKKIASKWSEMGYTGTDRGLVQNFMQFVNPQTWDSEEHFFEWLGMNYLEPEKRT